MQLGSPESTGSQFQTTPLVPRRSVFQANSPLEPVFVGLLHYLENGVKQFYSQQTSVAHLHAQPCPGLCAKNTLKRRPKPFPTISKGHSHPSVTERGARQR